MARVRAVFTFRGVTWLYKVYRDEDGRRGCIYEPKSDAFQTVYVDQKLTTKQLGEILDGKSFEFITEGKLNAVHL